MTKKLPAVRYRPGEEPTAKEIAQWVSDFKEFGFSHHNGDGDLIRELVEHCLDKEISFSLRANPGMAYLIVRLGRWKSDGLDSSLDARTTVMAALDDGRDFVAKWQPRWGVSVVYAPELEAEADIEPVSLVPGL